MDDKVSAERTDQELLVRELLVQTFLVQEPLALGYVRTGLECAEQYEC